MGSSPHKISSICCDSPVEAIFWRNCVSFLYHIPSLLGTETDNRHWISRRFTLLFSTFTVLKLWKSLNPFSHWGWRSFSSVYLEQQGKCNNFSQLWKNIQPNESLTYSLEPNKQKYSSTPKLQAECNLLILQIFFFFVKARQFFFPQWLNSS